MIFILQLQSAATFFTALGALLFFGESAAISALLGGLSCIFPNALFIWRLTINKNKTDKRYLQQFYLGEFLKVMFTIASVIAIATLYKNLHWISFVIALSLTLQIVLFSLLKKRKAKATTNKSANKSANKSELSEL